MNRLFNISALVMVAMSVLLFSAGNVLADYTANFDAGIEGWSAGDGAAWVSTGGQSGGYVKGSYGGCPYLTPDPALVPALHGNLSNKEITASYYLKNFSGTAPAPVLYMFADTDTTAGWDTLWQWTPEDNTVPTDWTNYTWTVDTSAASAPFDWTRPVGTASWADSWSKVCLWNFYQGGGSGTIVNGIDSVSFTMNNVPEPGTIVLVVTGLFGLLAYAWKRRR